MAIAFWVLFFGKEGGSEWGGVAFYGFFGVGWVEKIG
jgi:hypothetical protein